MANGVVSMSDDVYVLIGERIKTAREDRGWTQTQLGEAVGYSQATIGNYELGRRHVGIDDLYKIAEALGKPWAYFLGADKQVEEEAKREAESKVRRNVADFVGVRMLPVLRSVVPVDLPLNPADIPTTVPVPREFGPSADVVYVLDHYCSDSKLNVGDYVFIRRQNSERSGQILLADVSKCVGLVTYHPGPRYVWTVTGEPITTETVTVMGEFCGLYSEETFAHSVEVAGPEGWGDLDPEDQEQVQQFISFLRSRRGAGSK
jgi:repressor LexA